MEILCFFLYSQAALPLPEAQFLGVPIAADSPLCVCVHWHAPSPAFLLWRSDHASFAIAPSTCVVVVSGKRLLPRPVLSISSSQLFIHQSSITRHMWWEGAYTVDHANSGSTAHVKKGKREKLFKKGVVPADQSPLSNLNLLKSGFFISETKVQPRLSSWSPFLSKLQT